MYGRAGRGELGRGREILCQTNEILRKWRRFQPTGSLKFSLNIPSKESYSKSFKKRFKSHFTHTSLFIIYVIRKKNEIFLGKQKLKVTCLPDKRASISQVFLVLNNVKLYLFYDTENEDFSFPIHILGGNNKIFLGIFSFKFQYWVILDVPLSIHLKRGS